MHRKGGEQKWQGSMSTARMGQLAPGEGNYLASKRGHGRLKIKIMKEENDEFCITADRG